MTARQSRLVGLALLTGLLGVMLAVPTITHSWAVVLPVYLIVGVVLLTLFAAAWFFSRP